MVDKSRRRQRNADDESHDADSGIGHDDEGYDGEGLEEEDYDGEGHDGEDYDDEGHDDEGHDDEGHDDEGHDDEGHDGEGLEEEDYEAAIDGAYGDDESGEEDEIGTDELQTMDHSDDALVFGEVPAGVEAGQTYVGDLPVQEAPAATGDKTEILAAATGGIADFPILTIETADGSSDVEVVKDSFVIGRSPECDVVVPDQLVSRQHTVIEKRPDGWYVVDQNSGNGTFLNEQKIKEELLYDGDLIEVGDAAITFTAPGAEPDLSGGAPVSADKTQMLPASAVEGAPSGLTGSMYIPAPSGGKKKKILMIGSVVILLVALALVVKFVILKPAPPAGPTPQQLEAQKTEQARIADARLKFDKVKELAKEERWLEAMPLIREVAAVLNKDASVEKYKKTIQHEAAVASHIQEARDKMEAKDYEAALKALASVSPDSMQIEAVNLLKKELAEGRRAYQQEQARLAQSDGKFEEALELAMSMLQVNPGDDVAAEIKGLAERSIKIRDKVVRKPKKKKRKKRRSKQPKRNRFWLMGESLVSYRAAKVDLALSLAASSGVNEKYIKKLKTFRSLYTKGTELSRNAGQSVQAIKYLKKAHKMDKKLGGGKGKITENLNKRLAKVYFVKGNDAHQRRKYDVAFQSYSSSKRYKSLGPVVDGLRKLEMEAKKLYETSYVIKGNSPEKAVKHCKTVLTMVKKSSIYFTKCKKLIVRIQGPLGGGSMGGGDGF
ncbi:MAG: FHA domain-containing protein [Deltaproteobacteria bacterium]|nr:FHA domain-containing protein [Deltaproteobacteria bacterium]